MDNEHEQKKIRLDLNDIYSKFGFHDGDIICDFLNTYPSLEKRCAQLYKVVSKFVQDKEPVYLIISCHNPVRAKDIENQKDLGIIELTREELLAEI